MEVRGQFMEVSLLLPPCRLQESNSGHQAWQPPLIHLIDLFLFYDMRPLNATQTVLQLITFLPQLPLCFSSKNVLPYRLLLMISRQALKTHRVWKCLPYGLLNPLAALWSWLLHHSSLIYEENSAAKTATRPRSARADQSSGSDLSQSVPSISRLSYTLPTPAMASGTFDQITPGGSPQRYHQRKLMSYSHMLLSRRTSLLNYSIQQFLYQKTKMPSEPTRTWNSFNWDKSSF